LTFDNCSAQKLILLYIKLSFKFGWIIPNTKIRTGTKCKKKKNYQKWNTMKAHSLRKKKTIIKYENKRH